VANHSLVPEDKTDEQDAGEEGRPLTGSRYQLIAIDRVIHLR
jgi:hypothetical protein